MFDSQISQKIVKVIGEKATNNYIVDMYYSLNAPL